MKTMRVPAPSSCGIILSYKCPADWMSEEDLGQLLGLLPSAEFVELAPREFYRQIGCDTLQE